MVVHADEERQRADISGVSIHVFVSNEREKFVKEIQRSDLAAGVVEGVISV